MTGAAYTNSFGQTVGIGGVTTLYTLDASSNVLSIQNPPNNGTQTLSKAVTLNSAALDFTTVNGFDIAPDVKVDTNNTPVTGGKAYAVLTAEGVTNLYAIDLVSGAAAVIGPAFGGARGLRDRQRATRGDHDHADCLARASPRR